MSGLLFAHYGRGQVNRTMIYDFVASKLGEGENIRHAQIVGGAIRAVINTVDSQETRWYAVADALRWRKTDA